MFIRRFTVYRSYTNDHYISKGGVKELAVYELFKLIHGVLLEERDEASARDLAELLQDRFRRLAEDRDALQL